MEWGKRWYRYFSAIKKKGAETNGAQRDFSRPYSVQQVTVTASQKIENAEPDRPLTLAPA